MRRILNELQILLDRETQEIHTRNFARLAAIVRRKEELAGAFEAILSDAAFGSRSQALMKELAIIQRKAERNAADLLMMKQGFVDARTRIETILRNDSRTGLYGDKGVQLRARAAVSLARDV